MKRYLFLKKDFHFASMLAPIVDDLPWKEVLGAMPWGAKIEDIKEVLVSVDDGINWKCIYREGKEI